MKPRHGRNVYRRERSQSHKERPGWPRTKTQISPKEDFATSSESSLPAVSRGSCLRAPPAPPCPPACLPLLWGTWQGLYPQREPPPRVWQVGLTWEPGEAPGGRPGPLGSARALPVTQEGRPSALVPEESPSPPEGRPAWGGLRRPRWPDRSASGELEAGAASRPRVTDPPGRPSWWQLHRHGEKRFLGVPMTSPPALETGPRTPAQESHTPQASWATAPRALARLGPRGQD